ncbi:hypothetical protein [Pseudomonas hunanensis]|uniref:hypothetical protein n=1 Tax=Pseudomonas hunanensis TaxID=1247546 RepID=UPI0030D99A89
MSNDAPSGPATPKPEPSAGHPTINAPTLPAHKDKPFLATARGSFILALTSVISASFISVCSGPILMQLGWLAHFDFEKNYTHTILATALTLIALIVVYLREQAVNSVTADKEAELARQSDAMKADLQRQSEAMKADLERQSKEMEGRLTHMPPHQFVQEYVDTQAIIGLLRQAVKNDDKVTRDKVVEHTRSMLEGILALTRLWDGVSGTNKFVAYQTNIMLVFSNDEISLDNLVLPDKPPEKSLTTQLELPFPQDDVDETDEQTVDGLLDAENPLDEGAEEDQESAQTPPGNRADEVTREVWYMHDHFFLHNQNYEVALARCSGILLLQDELTITSRPINGKPSEIQQVCLPFTLKDKFDQDYHHPNLPGAPSVAASGEPEYIHNTQFTMNRWVDDQRDEVAEINSRYRDKIRKYYRNLEHSKSILSMPIYHDGKLIGILNVSKNAENMLLNADRADQFAQFMVPICYHLGKMLALLKPS